MNEDSKKVILDVEVNGANAVKNIADLTAKEESLRAKNAELKASTAALEKAQKSLISKNTELAEKLTGVADGVQLTDAEYAALSAEFEKNSAAIAANTDAIGKNRVTMAAAGEEIKAIRKEISSNSKAVQDEIKQNENAVDSYNHLSAELSRLKAAYKAAATDAEREVILKDLVKINDRLIELDEQQGVFVRHVGDYRGAIMDTLGNMDNGFGRAIRATKGLGQAWKTTDAIAKKSVVGAILFVIVGVLDKLMSKLNENQAAVETMSASFAAFNVVGVIVDRVLDAIADGLTWLIDKVGNLISKIGNLRDEMNESKRIAQEELELQKATRDMQLQNAKLTQDVAKLKAAAAEKDKRTAKERLDLLEQANEKELQISQNEVEIARRAYELQKAKNARSKSSQDDLDKEIELQIAMINAETAYFNKQKELNGQMVAARKEMTDANAKANAAEQKADDQAAKEAEKAAEEFAKRRADIRKQYGLISTEEQLAEEKAMLDKALADGVITQEEYSKIYADKKAKIEKEAADKAKADAEKAAQMRESVLSKYGVVTPGKSALDDQLKELQTALDKGLLSEQEYAQAVGKLYSDMALKKAESVVDIAQSVMGIADTINGAISDQENAALDEYKTDQDERKTALAKRLEDGLISQEQYNGKVAQIEAETAKREKELQMQQAKRQKAMAIMNATLNAAAAIIASLAASPVAIGVVPNPAGIASLALATATGVAQVAAAAATPLPKASRGALLHGASHANGGIPIEAEGGEAIINKKATARFLPLLSAINQSTGGVPLYGNGGTVGSAVSGTNEPILDYSKLAAACAQMNVSVAVTDINDGQSRVSRVVERKNY